MAKATNKEKQIKTEWCENFIKKLFSKHIIPGGGIEINAFWEAAAAAGLYTPGTYGTPMSEALEKLAKVELVTSDSGMYLYTVFKLA